MKTSIKTNGATHVAARVAGEDIRPGDVITPLSQIYEFPSFLWCSPAVALAVDEPVRSVYKAPDAGQPCKVVAVCLPFVYAKLPGGGMATFDTRQFELARLDPRTGRMVWKRLKATSKKKRK